MRCIGCSLKEVSGNFGYVTCKTNALHLLAETIRQFYLEVNALIASARVMFRRYCTCELCELCPHMLELPQLILTC